MQFNLSKDTLDETDKIVLAQFLSGIPEETDAAFTHNKESILNLVRNRMLGAGFMITDIGWHYGIAYAGVSFSSIRNSHSCSDRITVWSRAINALERFLKNKSLINVAYPLVVKAMLEMGNYNEWGYGIAKNDMSSIQKKKLDLRSFLNLIEDERIPLSEDLFDMYSIPYDEVMGRLKGMKEKEIREQIINECSQFL